MSVLKGYIKIKAEQSNPAYRMLVEKAQFEDTLGTMLLKYSDVAIFGFEGFNTGGETVGLSFSVGGENKKADVKKLTKYLESSGNKATAIASLNIAANSAKGVKGKEITGYEIIEVPSSMDGDMAIKLTFGDR